MSTNLYTIEGLPSARLPFGSEAYMSVAGRLLYSISRGQDTVQKLHYDTGWRTEDIRPQVHLLKQRGYIDGNNASGYTLTGPGRRLGRNIYEAAQTAYQEELHRKQVAKATHKEQ